MSPQPRAAVGAPLSRVDGRLKVTGQALYAAEHDVEGVLHAVIVDSSVGAGRITSVDTDAALAHPGVLRVLHHRNAPKLPYLDNPGSNNPEGRRLRVFQDDKVLFHGQPVAVVVATTLEAAQHGASLVKVGYDARKPSTDMAKAEPDPPTRYARGDAAAGLRDAAVRMDLHYRMARNHQNPMEPHATIARWKGDRLTVWDKTQWVVGTQTELSTVFDLPLKSVRVISPFVGGGFGSGLRCWPHTVVAALAARELKRPVKLVLSRKQMYLGTGFRPSYDYRLRLGSDRRGRLAAMVHEMDAETSSYEKFEEAIMLAGQMFYSTPNVSQEYRKVPLDVNTPLWMRGPGFANASFAIESAMDELANKLVVDPIELRLRNEPAEDESNGLPWSTRKVRECYTVGAREFGWARRNPKPRSTRDGDWLIGLGMAAGVYDPGRFPAQARVRLDADGTAVAEAATIDMGPGTYTSQTQVAADALGLNMRAVTFRLGDSLYPPTPPHGGSMTMTVVGSAVLDGCNKVRTQAIKLAVEDDESPLYGVRAEDVIVRGGRLHVPDDPARGETYQRLLTRNRLTHLEADGAYAGAPEPARHSYFSYGAVFTEVGVDATLGLVRVRRMLGVYDVGRIVSPKLADSQALGGMVGGIGQALLEHTVTDHRDGRIVNASLADYLVPVNADISDLRAIYLESEDPRANPLGVKGIGEIVQVGVAAAVANAVFNATGRRVRELPITAEALI
ncbi:putative oxidoreductase [Streptomyces scabiei 87.22]|uniref:Putative oxidoreductase n=2 Tax=Streptomyces scabiei TaxID=1930 RepID=C9YSX1_STRSW|nr:MULTISPECIES: xanthine dehydrogenase family protein molybdopterin-binding subunit [Streptomyces]MBP5859387.1 xanthine dehydrogenase family protein molybdopterin-binding subunit [Streptomyces sp. LBUM 1484]MBP5880466.1 xanthine dehydrogenase family protein molybdopterin-binding subunit [Streptomyces sp. LBUM 1477]MBP5888300.1 xanthine dehydrogenase family protein molybdopterin-binding subunit [Streptomyces sp. LBUM 1487]MBP5904321.1 xanthine dehydrogenase family protein molybdopterin-binding 